MKTSFVTTVLNEEASITKFLESIYSQTKLPDEIIIVDAGSTDKTIEKISHFQIPQKGPEIKLIFKRGNRSFGRNEGVKKASFDIILISDAGCILDKNWVRNIIKPFSDTNISVSSGYYLPLCKNKFQKCLATYTCVMPDKVNREKFLPSSRSIAFRKLAWKKVGGYPQNLNTCEDLIFAKKLKKAGFKFNFADDAIVHWPQRKSFSQAFWQFFNYAKGDGEARFIRRQTPFLFGRYLLGLVLLLDYVLWQRTFSLYLLLLLGVVYLAWSILKNYKYVKQKEAFYLLPSFQIVSDFAVMTGMTYGYMKTIKIFSKDNIGLTAVIIIYAGLMLSVIKWGIPNVNHPFNYHMDEWHQLQSIRNIFSYGTNNMAGSANGPMLQFILSGIFLAPFYFLKIINPFAISSLVANLEMQEKIFIFLRLNSLMFGVLTIIYLSKIIKEFFKINSTVLLAFFVFSPIWLSLSNYFKYDIALIFWLTISTYFIIKFISTKDTKNFLIACFLSSLAVATKISGLPVLLLLLVSYGLVFKQITNKLKTIALGMMIFATTFLFLGVPDLVFLRKGNYYEYFFSNLVLGPSQLSNYTLGSSWLKYLVRVQYPISFGIGLCIVFLIALLVSVANTLYRLTKGGSDRTLWFLLSSIIIFFASLLLIKIDSRGNRSLVLLPYLILLTGYFLKDLKGKVKKVAYGFMMVLLIFQAFQASDFIHIKLKSDPRELSSAWINNNIAKNSLIGLENVPIYQQIPDVLLKDYYKQKYTKSRYDYVVVDYKTEKIPDIVVITNADFEKAKVKISNKNKLVQRLFKNGYIVKEAFTQRYPVSEKIFKHEDIFFTGLIPMPKIEFYEK